MNRGRGRQLLALVGGAVLLGGAGLLVLKHISREDAFAKATAATMRIERDHFDAFFGCALPGVRRSQLNAEGVHSAFESLGDRQGKSYGKTLSRCLPQMQALTAGVATLKVPREVKAEQAALVTAVAALAAANARYLSYLTDGAREYEYVGAMPLLEKFGAAWTGYYVAQRDLKRALEERL